jgi:hypothetical protein
MLAIFAAVHRSAIVEKPLLAHIVGDRIDVPVAFLGLFRTVAPGGWIGLQ